MTWAQQVGQPSASPAAATQPAGAASTAPAGGTPKFRCDDTSTTALQWVYEFPEVWSGDPVEHSFIVHNDGNAVLEILEVRPTCGCTVAQYDKQIQPGSQGKITAKLTTKGIHYPVTKTINVKTNDPKAAQLILQLKGTVKARILVDPQTGAQFGQSATDAPLTRTVKLTNNTDKPLKLERGPLAEQNPFNYELKEIEPGKVFEMTINVDKAKLKEGPNFVQLMLKTNIEQESEVMVPANIYVPPIVQVQPPTIAVATPVAAKFTRQITLTCAKGAMKVTDVKTSDPAIKVQYAAATVPETQPAGLPKRVPGQVWNLTVNVDAGWDPPQPVAKPFEITVTTDVKEKPEIKVLTHVYPLTPPVTAETLVGKPAPVDNSLKTTTGQAISLGGKNGHVAVTVFWASWCPHCKRMLPMMQHIADLYGKRGVDFNLISLDQTVPPDQVAKVVKALDVNLPFAVDAKQVAGKKYGANRFPMTFLVSKDGIIEGLHHGATDTYEPNIKAQLEVLLAGKNRSAFPPLAVSTRPAGVQTTATPPPTNLQDKPVLLLDNLQQDMGAHKPGATGTFSLYLRNGGSPELKVTNVATSEGLKLDPSYPKSVLANAPAALRLQFTAPKQPGPFQHQVTIQTNDANKPEVTVKLTGTVRKLIELDPAGGVDFGRRPVTFTMDRLASLVWNGEGAVKFLSVESNSPRFEATLRPIQQGPHYMVVVKAKPPFDKGENTGTLFVKTDCKEQPVIEVPVKLYQPPRVDLLPAAVTFNKAPRLQQASVAITNNGTSSINVLSVKTSSPKIRTQFYPEVDGLSYRLQVTLLTGFSPAAEGDKVTVRTDDAEYPEIVIPVKVADSAEAGKGLSQAK